MQIPTRTFSLEEANQIVPQVEEAFKRFFTKRDSLERHHDAFLMEELIALRTAHVGVYDPGRHLDLEAQELDSEVLSLASEIRAIHRLGCRVRNLDHGWVDFPGIHFGSRIFFCWRLGEKQITHYHTDKDLTPSRFLLRD
ncbi:MAG: DUF2203 family protein [Candidatus Omnitrophica bacterium]|nr:DUF2203 family protein [Candidatus Omnitrophota bacterium]